jgi:hypothetical protein
MAVINMAKVDTFIAADNYFSMIPHWVLYSDISAQAIRLYGVLQHYANKEESKGAWPARATLAKEIHAKSPRTVDAALKELISIGAIILQHRFKDNAVEKEDNKRYKDSNRYLIITSNQNRFKGIVQNIAPGGSAENYANLVQNIAHKKEPLKKINLEKEPEFIVDAELLETSVKNKNLSTEIEPHSISTAEVAKELIKETYRPLRPITAQKEKTVSTVLLEALNNGISKAELVKAIPLVIANGDHVLGWTLTNALNGKKKSELKAEIIRGGYNYSTKTLLADTKVDWSKESMDF